MKRIFGARKEQPKAPTLDEATDNLNKRGDSLDEKIRKLDEQLLKHRDAIRSLRPGPAQDAAKKRAMVVMRQKKLYEGQREQLYNQQYNVDSAAFTMQSMQDSVQVVQAMQAGAKQMKTMQKQHKELNVDEIWKTMDQMADMHADFEEIQDAMGSYNVPDGIDEGDLEAELDALGDEVAAEGVAGEGLPAYLQEPQEALPEAPTGAAAVPAGGAAHVAQRLGEDEFGLPQVAAPAQR